MLCVYSHKLVLYLHALEISAFNLGIGQSFVLFMLFVQCMTTRWMLFGGTSASYLKSTSTERLAE